MRRMATLLPLAGLLLGALALWGSSRLSWVHARVEAEQLGTAERSLAGAHWAPEVVALALGLVACAAVFAFTRGRLARVVAAVVFCLSALAALPGAQLLAGGGDTDRAHSIVTSQEQIARTSGSTGTGQVESVPEWAAVVAADPQPTGPALSIVGALLAMAGALVGVIKPKAAPAEGDRYRTPGQLREAAEASDTTAAEPRKRELSQQDSDRLLWDDLDSGGDPTSDTRGG